MSELSKKNVLPKRRAPVACQPIDRYMYITMNLARYTNIVYPIILGIFNRMLQLNNDRYYRFYDYFSSSRVAIEVYLGYCDPRIRGEREEE